MFKYFKHKSIAPPVPKLLCILYASLNSTLRLPDVCPNYLRESDSIKEHVGMSTFYKYYQIRAKTYCGLHQCVNRWKLLSNCGFTYGSKTRHSLFDLEISLNSWRKFWILTLATQLRKQRSIMLVI